MSILAKASRLGDHAHIIGHFRDAHRLPDMQHVGYLEWHVNEVDCAGDVEYGRSGV